MRVVSLMVLYLKKIFPESQQFKKKHSNNTSHYSTSVSFLLISGFITLITRENYDLYYNITSLPSSIQNLFLTAMINCDFQYILAKLHCILLNFPFTTVTYPK